MGYHHKHHKEERITLQEHAENVLKVICSTVPALIYLLFIAIMAELVRRIFLTSII